MGSTYRLKRKLNDEGVELGGRRANENFCLIGTPLPPLEKSKDSGEFVPVWKQDVRDEQGRRRLHGAFTGGFSAGYFNTVGSKEGWTPQTFVSSRSDRTKKTVARPEDYMDEEDLAELRENQVKSGIQEKMDLLGGTQAELGRLSGTGDEEDDSMTRRIERTLITPTNDSPGARLLRKMGWRPGHGVGPRVSWRQRKIQDLHAQGKSLEGVDIDKLEDDEEAKKHMYPPRDTQVPKISRKENAFGLGYVPGLGLNQSSGKGEGTKKQSGPQLSAGFGLGALNDAEDDDIDVYESTVQAGRTRMAYDASDRDADDTISIGASAKRRHPTETAPVDANSRFWPDGTPVLKGFIPASNPVQTSQWFSLPEIPKGWKPDPKRVWDKAKENVAPPPPTEVGVKGQSKLTAEQRGQALGETPLPSAPRSIFDYISAKDRERIQKLASGASETALPPPPPTTTNVPSFPFTPPDVASAALKGYMPFPSDPVKQSRYIAYLRSQADPSSSLTPKPLPNQAADVFHKEMEEYAKSAALFKPMSGAMAGRFTSAALVDNGPKIIEGLYQPVHPPSPPPLSEEEKAKAKERERQELAEKRMEEEMAEGSKGHAAKMGMYGALTREVKPWQPSKLLCKRFGVKDPNPDVSTETPMPGVPPAASASAAGAGPSTASGSQAQGGNGWQPEQALAEAGISLEEAGLSENAASGLGGAGSSRRGRKDLENVGLGEDEDQGRDTLTYVRPSMDVFKAIFASDDEDSGDEEEDAAETKKEERSMNGDEDVEMKVAELKTPPVAGPSRLKDGDEEHLPMDVDSTNGSNAAHEKVDLASFKPTFIPRAERETKKSKDKSKEKKPKKSKVIVSFDTEEDGGGGLSIAPKKSSDKDKDGESKKKKRRKDKDKEREKGKVQEDDEDMWVEKPPPEAVKTLQTSMARSESPMVISDSGEGPNASGPRGRKRAVDFM